VVSLSAPFYPQSLMAFNASLEIMLVQEVPRIDTPILEKEQISFRGESRIEQPGLSTPINTEPKGYQEFGRLGYDESQTRPQQYRHHGGSM